jgi:hypothetical protein
MEAIMMITLGALALAAVTEALYLKNENKQLLLDFKELAAKYRHMINNDI